MGLCGCTSIPSLVCACKWRAELICSVEMFVSNVKLLLTSIGHCAVSRAAPVTLSINKNGNRISYLLLGLEGHKSAGSAECVFPCEALRCTEAPTRSWPVKDQRHDQSYPMCDTQSQFC